MAASPHSNILRHALKAMVTAHPNSRATRQVSRSPCQRMHRAWKPSLQVPMGQVSDPSPWRSEANKYRTILPIRASVHDTAEELERVVFFIPRLFVVASRASLCPMRSRRHYAWVSGILRPGVTGSYYVRPTASPYAQC